MLRILSPGDATARSFRDRSGRWSWHRRTSSRSPFPFRISSLRCKTANEVAKEYQKFAKDVMLHARRIGRVHSARLADQAREVATAQALSRTSSRAIS